MKKLVIVVGVLALASVASADLVCEVLTNPSPGAGLSSYTIYFKGATPGEYLSAFDGRFDGPMNQGWFYWKSAWLTTAWIGDFATGESASWDCDTHVLVGRPAGGSGDQADYGVLIAQGANEDLNTTGWTPSVTPTPDGNGYQFGLGSYLANTLHTNMAFAIASAQQTENVAFAQIVTQGGTVVLTGKAVANNSSYIDLNMVIPEPATLALLAMGAAAVVARKRRRTA